MVFTAMRELYEFVRQLLVRDLRRVLSDFCELLVNPRVRISDRYHGGWVRVSSCITFHAAYVKALRGSNKDHSPGELIFRCFSFWRSFLFKRESDFPHRILEKLESSKGVVA